MSKPVTYQRESFLTAYAEADERHIVQAHWDEVATMPDVRKLKMDLDKYRVLEEKNLLVFVSARHGGKLIGYIAGILAPDMHAMESRLCVMDVYYIVPEWRGIAVYLFRHYQDEAKKAGATLVNARQKIRDGEPVVPDRFFQLLGYSKQEVSWYRRL